MGFVNYYAVLQVSPNATKKELDDAYFKIFNEGSVQDFDVATEAFKVLSDPRRRAQYDKSLGFLMAIQTEPAEFPGGMAFLLTRPDQAHLKLLGIVEDFKNWVTKKTSLDWEEAQEENYAYALDSDSDVPSLVLRFARESDLAGFANKLKDEKRIKPA